MKLNLFLTALAITFLMSPKAVNAQDSLPQNNACEARTSQTLAQGEFTKKRYTISGNWQIDQDCTSTIVNFGESFKTKGGPDLKVYLSKLPLSELSNKTVDRNGMKLSVLKANQGAQSYTIPADVNLSEYKSVVIHCEAFSVLWGGFDLPE
ncbi:DM13 domain-containing protein [Litorimonas sp. RW-G-Af-16]|uniref:DM13 domain-containing protein n=1 Tax=Litorimonas sp. RW-G-Af-16 TaxID=3241168 RepID=UPI00390C6779